MQEPNPLINLIVSRRSVSTLIEPGPSPDQLRSILLAASAVPDHGLLRPFRFVVAEGEGRAQFGDALARTAQERMPGLPPHKFDGIRQKAFRSPTLVALISSPKPGKIAVWEQSATAACAGYAIVLAAHALGVGAIWKSVPFTKGSALSEVLGLTEDEEMLGWIHLGQPGRDDEASPRVPLALDEVVTVLADNARRPYR